MSLPRGFMQWNLALRGAFVKGATCALEGGTRDACPYADRRKAGGQLTWSRAFIRAWQDGYDYAEVDPEDARITVRYRAAKKA